MLDYIDASFQEKALSVFNYQYENCLTYRGYCDLISVSKSQVNVVAQIPFLPIQFFKTHYVSCKDSYEKVFKSSGTTSSLNAKHYVFKQAIYEESFINGFQSFYGSIEDYVFLALLPSYLEQGDSSLVAMFTALIKKSSHLESAFYLNNLKELKSTLDICKKYKKKTILIGVTYALLDFIESFDIDFPELIVMETGGMKGRRKELIKSELHKILKQGFKVQNIHSEYGMTELLSQAYSQRDGIFYPTETMKIVIRNTYNPLEILHPQKSGIINIIDLSNYYSCSFIATDDLGIVYSDGSFEVFGRNDFVDVRGCNLMLSDFIEQQQ